MPQTPEQSGDIHIHLDRASPAQPRRVIVEFSIEPGPTQLISLVEADERFINLDHAVAVASAMYINHGMPNTRTEENISPDLIHAIDDVEMYASKYAGGGKRAPRPVDMVDMVIDKVFKRPEFNDWRRFKRGCRLELKWHVADAIEHPPSISKRKK